MFGKKKIELDNNELRIIRYSLVEFRNDLIKQNRYTDAIDDVIPKLKDKMKAIKSDLGVILNALYYERNAILAEEGEIEEIDVLMKKLLDIHKTL